MSLRACPRQPEIRQLLARGHWPHACPPELRVHIDSCAACAELLLVTRAFLHARTTTAAQAQLPAPSAIWWRAQLRRRNAAVERVGKPIQGAYIFAFSIALVAAGLLAVSQARQVLRWLNALSQYSSAQDWLGQSQPALHNQASSASAWFTSGLSLPVLIPVLATVLVLGAVVVYLAAERQ